MKLSHFPPELITTSLIIIWQIQSAAISQPFMELSTNQNLGNTVPVPASFFTLTYPLVVSLLLCPNWSCT
ncbi:hypothetical protein LC612_35675 [Nostoc sp. CHAB 5834]|nr:hypothetical protein [Nostoc sp. CHAB 5834]